MPDTPGKSGRLRLLAQVGLIDKLFRSIFAAVPAALAAILSLTGAGIQWTPTATVVVTGGMGWETVDEPIMRAILDSRYDQPDNTFVNIEWPAYLGTLGDSVDEASDSLYAHIMATDGPQIAIGVSGSTFVVNEVMRRLAEDPDPDKPTPQDISFVIIGDGERGIIPAVVPFTGPDLPYIAYTTQPIPVTPYDAIVVKGEYDGLADWPDRPWNLLAVANALIGSPATDYGRIHWDSIWVDLDTIRAQNVTTEVNAAGGTTTTYLVTTAQLPILSPLREQGVPEQMITLLSSVLKPIVDSGYARNDPAWLKDLRAWWNPPPRSQRPWGDTTPAIRPTRAANPLAVTARAAPAAAVAADLDHLMGPAATEAATTTEKTAGASAQPKPASARNSATVGSAPAVKNSTAKNSTAKKTPARSATRRAAVTR